MNFRIDGSEAQKWNSALMTIVLGGNHFLPMTGPCMRLVGLDARSNVFRRKVHSSSLPFATRPAFARRGRRSTLSEMVLDLVLEEQEERQIVRCRSRNSMDMET